MLDMLLDEELWPDMPENGITVLRMLLVDGKPFELVVRATGLPQSKVKELFDQSIRLLKKNIKSTKRKLSLVGEQVVVIEEEADPKEIRNIENRQWALAQKISESELPPRAKRALGRIGVETNADLLKMSRQDLLQIDKLGTKTVRLIKRYVDSYGLELKK